jgi:predicted dehydrogenase
MTNDLRQHFGRPLRLGLVGGAPGTWIANMHRSAAELDGWWRLAAGVFSSDPARSRAAGPAMGIDPARSYGDVAEMLQREHIRDPRLRHPRISPFFG